MTTEIITIGNELMAGMRVDTNSAWIASRFYDNGIAVSRISSVSDSFDDILAILIEAEKRSDIVVLTGGLGPTADDVTKPALCQFFDTKLVHNPAVLTHIEELLAKRGSSLNALNRTQANLPEVATVLQNNQGTAPGLWFEKGGKIFISLPGVPFEMKPLLLEAVIPKLKSRFTFPLFYHKTILVQGLFESQLAEMISEFENALPKGMSLAYLPSPGIIRLQIKTTGSDMLIMEKGVKLQVDKLYGIIGEFIAGYDDEELEVIIGNLLKERGQTISVAESCTGGAISSMITSVPGSSTYFKGGIVAYSNEVKRDQLAVNRAFFDEVGAVSREVVEEMAENARLLFNTNYCVAVSGVAGPGGGSAEKPVGTVWIAVSGSGSMVSDKFAFGDNRAVNIKRASVTALGMLRKTILGLE